jgi:hypothetical protein
MYTRAVPKPDKRPPKPRKALVRTRMKRGPSKRVKAKTAEERRFLAWLHTQPCRAWFSFSSHWCEGPIQAAHYRDHTGAGLCEPYITCIPLCRGSHDEYDGRAPAKQFRDWSLEEKKRWHVRQQAATQAAWSRA